MSIGAEVSIAGVDFRFTHSQPTVGAWLSQRFGAFLRQSPARAPIEIELAMEGDELHPRVDGAPIDLEEGPGGELSLAGECCSAWIDGNAARAVVSGELSAQPIDAVVRLLLARRLLDAGALLVHASAVVMHGGNGVVFAGPSGAGKSTLATAIGETILSDEAVVLERAPDGIVARATPYWRGRPASAPVGALLLVGRGDTRSWEPVSAARAAAALSSLSGPLPPMARERAFDVASSLVRACGQIYRANLATLSDISEWLTPHLSAVLRFAG